ncbi:MAG: hypothetical protein ACOXZK_07570 [Bacteroidales bacterium]
MALLSVTNELFNSINYDVKGNTVIIRSDKEYSAIHNWGGTIHSQVPVTPKMRKICLGYALPAISQTLYVLFYPHLQGRKDLVGVWLLLGCIDVFSFNPTRFLKPCRMLLSFSSF